MGKQLPDNWQMLQHALPDRQPFAPGNNPDKSGVYRRHDARARHWLHYRA
jgi:hypothetical protein